jgi:hypothetical protein
MHAAGVAVVDEVDQTEETYQQDDILSESAKGPIRSMGTCGRSHGFLRDRVCLWLGLVYSLSD